MPILRVMPQGRQIRLTSGETVLQALERSGIDLQSECGGQGICGKCTVLVDDPDSVPLTPHPRISADDEQRGVRLACRIRPERDMAISLVEPGHQTGAADLAWILGSESLGLETIRPAVSRTWSQGRSEVRVQTDEGTELTVAWPAETGLLGAALDVGTTSLVVAVYDLEAGRELGSASGLNPQRIYGSDVLSRIRKGSTPDGLGRLTGLVRDELNELLATACNQAGQSASHLLDLTVGGNTTMLQLLAGLDPAPLGHSPFQFSLMGGRSYPAADFGLQAHPQARVYLPPILHAYAGTDLSAGLLAADFFPGQAPVLFMDIGTNGEMALRNGRRKLASSAAAGPAFEGSGLRSGMPASAGAIEQVWLDRGRLRFSTMGNTLPRGICGSGFVDLIACLLHIGRLEPSGRLLRPAEGPSLPPGSSGYPDQIDGLAVFRLQDEVMLTQEDVRTFQLAKSAVRTGLDVLLQRAGLIGSQLQSFILAGGFGRSLRPSNLEAVGMIPPGSASKLSFRGNTSLAGAARLLLDAPMRSSLETSMGDVDYVHLASEDRFMELFVDNMNFPNPRAGHDEPAAALSSESQQGG